MPAMHRVAHGYANSVAVGDRYADGNANSAVYVSDAYWYSLPVVLGDGNRLAVAYANAHFINIVFGDSKRVDDAHTIDRVLLHCVELRALPKHGGNVCGERLPVCVPTELLRLQRESS